ncbi:MAG: glucose-6-phosphate isomerase [Deltaproteobacteria bacterium]|nr:glucose-6-phosphate isomerase [Deltaproteobacteria bacterium]
MNHTIKFSPGSFQAEVDAALAEMAGERIVARIWEKDYTVWKPSPVEIVNRLGWLKSAEDMTNKLALINAAAQKVHAGGYNRLILLGMGGSSLAPEVFHKTFGARRGYPVLMVHDSTDPGAVLASAEAMDPGKTLFVVSTKSGGTVETFSFLKYFYNVMAQSLGAERTGEHFIAITDSGSALADLAVAHNFRELFLNDPDIGGRYSALSYFGLVPAALTGVDIKAVLDRAVAAQRQEQAGDARNAGTPCGAYLGAVLGEMARRGRNKVTFILSPRIAGFGDWLEQLLAESTGKEGKGILPVTGEPFGDPHAYGDDRLFVSLRLKDDDTNDAGLNAIEQAGHPVVEMQLDDPYDLGAQCFLWEMATAVAGWRLGINPFDQPDVEAAKVLARKMIARYREEGSLPAERPALSDDGVAVYGEVQAATAAEALIRFLSHVRPGDYVAIHAYLCPSAETDAALGSLRRRIRERSGVATTVGYGPRFLHSTGQLHKGDGGQGLFIQLTADDPRDAPIPDELGAPASSVTFGVLKTAQAMGDREALMNAGRRVMRFHLGKDSVGGLRRLINT